MIRPCGSLRGAAVAVLAAAVLVGGCGTRASTDEVRAGVDAGPVTLDQATVDQLRAAAEAGRTAANVPAAGAPVPLAPGTAPGPATKPGTAPSGPVNTATGTTPVSPGSAAATAGATCTASGTPIVLGQIGSFSGVLGPLTSSARTALAVWAKHVNAGGGLACHPVQIYAFDDGADSSRAAALVQQLATQQKAQALIGLFAPLSMAGIVSGLDKAKLPVVGGDAMMPEWNSHPLLFPQGAGLDAAVEGGLRQTIGSGKTKLGLLYCVEASICTAVAKTLPARAKAAGGEMVYSSPVSLTQTDFTAQCQNAKNAGVQAFGMGVDGSAIARVARSCAALGYFPQFISGGGVISAAQSKDPGIRKNTLSVASGNAPWMLTDTPGQKEYAQALKTYAPGLETDANSLSAWAAGKLLEAAVGKLGPGARDKPLTTETVLTGLGKIKNETLGGLAPPFTFTPGQKFAPALKCVYFELLTEQGWTAPNGSKPVCN